MTTEQPEEYVKKKQREKTFDWEEQSEERRVSQHQIESGKASQTKSVKNSICDNSAVVQQMHRKLSNSTQSQKDRGDRRSSSISERRSSRCGKSAKYAGSFQKSELRWPSSERTNIRAVNSGRSSRKQDKDRDLSDLPSAGFELEGVERQQSGRRRSGAGGTDETKYYRHQPSDAKHENADCTGDEKTSSRPVNTGDKRENHSRSRHHKCLGQRKEDRRRSGESVIVYKEYQNYRQAKSVGRNRSGGGEKGSSRSGRRSRRRERSRSSRKKGGSGRERSRSSRKKGGSGRERSRSRQKGSSRRGRSSSRRSRNGSKVERSRGRFERSSCESEEGISKCGKGCSRHVRVFYEHSDKHIRCTAESEMRHNMRIRRDDPICHNEKDKKHREEKDKREKSAKKEKNQRECRSLHGSVQCPSACNSAFQKSATEIEHEEFLPLSHKRERVGVACYRVQREEEPEASDCAEIADAHSLKKNIAEFKERKKPNSSALQSSSPSQSSNELELTGTTTTRRCKTTTKLETVSTATGIISAEVSSSDATFSRLSLSPAHCSRRWHGRAAAGSSVNSAASLERACLPVATRRTHHQDVQQLPRNDHQNSQRPGPDEASTGEAPQRGFIDSLNHYKLSRSSSSRARIRLKTNSFAGEESRSTSHKEQKKSDQEERSPAKQARSYGKWIDGHSAKNPVSRDSGRFFRRSQVTDKAKRSSQERQMEPRKISTGCTEASETQKCTRQYTRLAPRSSKEYMDYQARSTKSSTVKRNNRDRSVSTGTVSSKSSPRHRCNSRSSLCHSNRRRAERVERHRDYSSRTKYHCEAEHAGLECGRKRRSQLDSNASSYGLQVESSLLDVAAEDTVKYENVSKVSVETEIDKRGGSVERQRYRRITAGEYKVFSNKLLRDITHKEKFDDESHPCLYRSRSGSNSGDRAYNSFHVAVERVCSREKERSSERCQTKQRNRSISSMLRKDCSASDIAQQRKGYFRSRRTEKKRSLSGMDRRKSLRRDGRLEDNFNGSECERNLTRKKWHSDNVEGSTSCSTLRPNLGLNRHAESVSGSGCWRTAPFPVVDGLMSSVRKAYRGKTEESKERHDDVSSTVSLSEKKDTFSNKDVIDGRLCSRYVKSVPREKGPLPTTSSSSHVARWLWPSGTLEGDRTSFLKRFSTADGAIAPPVTAESCYPVAHSRHLSTRRKSGSQERRHTSSKARYFAAGGSAVRSPVDSNDIGVCVRRLSMDRHRTNTSFSTTNLNSSTPNCDVSCETTTLANNATNSKASLPATVGAAAEMCRSDHFPALPTPPKTPGIPDRATPTILPPAEEGSYMQAVNAAPQSHSVLLCASESSDLDSEAVQTSSNLFASPNVAHSPTLGGAGRSTIASPRNAPKDENLLQESTFSASVTFDARDSRMQSPLPTNSGACSSSNETVRVVESSGVSEALLEGKLCSKELRQRISSQTTLEAMTTTKQSIPDTSLQSDSTSGHRDLIKNKSNLDSQEIRAILTPISNELHVLFEKKTQQSRDKDLTATVPESWDNAAMLESQPGSLITTEGISERPDTTDLTAQQQRTSKRENQRQKTCSSPSGFRYELAVGNKQTHDRSDASVQSEIVVDKSCSNDESKLVEEKRKVVAKNRQQTRVKEKEIPAPDSWNADSKGTEKKKNFSWEQLLGGVSIKRVRKVKTSGSALQHTQAAMATASAASEATTGNDKPFFCTSKSSQRDSHYLQSEMAKHDTTTERTAQHAPYQKPPQTVEVCQAGAEEVHSLNVNSAEPLCLSRSSLAQSTASKDKKFMSEDVSKYPLLKHICCGATRGHTWRTRASAVAAAAAGAAAEFQRRRDPQVARFLQEMQARFSAQGEEIATGASYINHDVEERDSENSLSSRSGDSLSSSDSRSDGDSSKSRGRYCDQINTNIFSDSDCNLDRRQENSGTVCVKKQRCQEVGGNLLTINDVDMLTDCDAKKRRIFDFESVRKTCNGRSRRASNEQTTDASASSFYSRCSSLSSHSSSSRASPHRNQTLDALDKRRRRFYRLAGQALRELQKLHCQQRLRQMEPDLNEIFTGMKSRATASATETTYTSVLDGITSPLDLLMLVKKGLKRTHLVRRVSSAARAAAARAAAIAVANGCSQNHLLLGKTELPASFERWTGNTSGSILSPRFRKASCENLVSMIGDVERPLPSACSFRQKNEGICSGSVLCNDANVLDYSVHPVCNTSRTLHIAKKNLSRKEGYQRIRHRCFLASGQKANTVTHSRRLSGSSILLQEMPKACNVLPRRQLCGLKGCTPNVWEGECSSARLIPWQKNRFEEVQTKALRTESTYKHVVKGAMVSSLLDTAKNSTPAAVTAVATPHITVAATLTVRGKEEKRKIRADCNTGGAFSIDESSSSGKVNALVDRKDVPEGLHCGSLCMDSPYVTFDKSAADKESVLLLKKEGAKRSPVILSGFDGESHVDVAKREYGKKGRSKPCFKNESSTVVGKHESMWREDSQESRSSRSCSCFSQASRSSSTDVERTMYDTLDAGCAGMFVPTHSIELSSPARKNAISAACADEGAGTQMLLQQRSSTTVSCVAYNGAVPLAAAGLSNGILCVCCLTEVCPIQCLGPSPAVQRLQGDGNVPGAAVCCVAWQQEPDGLGICGNELLLGVGREGGCIDVYDLRMGEKRKAAMSWRAHHGPVVKIQFLSNNACASASSADMYVRFWDLRGVEGSRGKALSRESSRISCTSDDGSHLATSASLSVLLHHSSYGNANNYFSAENLTPDGFLLRSVKVDSGVCAFALSPDEELLAIASTSGEVQLMTSPLGPNPYEPLLSFPSVNELDCISFLKFSNNDRNLLVAGERQYSQRMRSATKLLSYPFCELWDLQDTKQRCKMQVYASFWNHLRRFGRDYDQHIAVPKTANSSSFAQRDHNVQREPEECNSLSSFSTVESGFSGASLSSPLSDLPFALFPSCLAVSPWSRSVYSNTHWAQHGLFRAERESLVNSLNERLNALTVLEGKSDFANSEVTEAGVVKDQSNLGRSQADNVRGVFASDADVANSAGGCPYCCRPYFLYINGKTPGRPAQNALCGAQRGKLYRCSQAEYTHCFAEHLSQGYKKVPNTKFIATEQQKQQHSPQPDPILNEKGFEVEFVRQSGIAEVIPDPANSKELSLVQWIRGAGRFFHGTVGADKRWPSRRFVCDLWRDKVVGVGGPLHLAGALKLWDASTGFLNSCTISPASQDYISSVAAHPRGGPIVLTGGGSARSGRGTLNLWGYFTADQMEALDLVEMER